MLSSRTLRALCVVMPLLLAPALASADAKAELSSAEAAYSSLDLDKASSTAQKVLRAGRLSHADLVRATRLIALCNAAQDRDEQARDAFVLLLAYDPSYEVDAKLGPRYRTPYNEARGFWAAQSARPGVEVAATLRGDAPGTLRVTTRDPTNVIKRVVVSWRWAPATAFTARTVGAGDISVEIPAPSKESTRLDYFVTAEDSNGSIAFEAGNAGVPRTSIVPLQTASAAKSEKKSVVKSPWFWVTTGLLAAGGATAAVYFATRSGTTTTEWRPTLTCGGAACE